MKHITNCLLSLKTHPRCALVLLTLWLALPVLADDPVLVS